MRTKGDKGEAFACRYLAARGFHIVARNFSTRGGEIDVVGKSPEGVLVFFEIKLRAREPLDHSALVPFQKRMRLRRAIGGFLSVHGGARWRCDLILLVVHRVARRVRVVWYRNICLTDA